ncbi:hypothetical protein SSP531S_24920 [Streptomyces spongiicola]|uniref:Large membrane protein n=1 Tax=Streptomyces spongiicola TaxID=1690221 RepID=A0A388SYW0_9ACTN|nr:hypothetical protein [Streptomyces spongiicola]GBQ01062.1 hypothetical protein SSP531S_24920 [Streptomyces spongiicola]
MSSTERPQNSADGAGGPEGGAVRRLRRSPLAVASVAAAVLVAGGGGTWFAATALDGGGGVRGGDGGAAPGTGPEPPPLALDGATGIAVGEPGPYGVRYRAQGGLPDGPGSARLHEVNGTVGKAQVEALAEALGVPGEPLLRGDVWKAGADGDAGGPMLQVNRQAPGTWTFSAFGPPKGDDCAGGKDVCDPPATGPAAPRPPNAPAVSEAAAKKAAAPVLAALGLGDARLDARQVLGAHRVVRADPLVGGLPTYGWSTSVHVAADGTIGNGSGQLVRPAAGPEYPVVGAEEALKRLNAERSAGGPVGIGGCATPGPLAEGKPPEEKPAEGKPAEGKPAAPCEPESGAPVPAEVVKVTGAEFGLAVRSLEGRPALVPSWLFATESRTGAPGATVVFPAVAPEYLKSAAERPPAPPATAVPSPPDDSKLPETSIRSVESYAVAKDGRTLTLRFWGGVCSTYSAEAEETGSEVKVKIIVSRPDPGRVCILIAKELTEEVTLSEPLGDRTVVDEESGDAVPRR